MKKHWKRWLAGFLALTLAVSTGVYRSYDFKAVDPDVTTEVEQVTPDVVVEEIEVVDASTETATGEEAGGDTVSTEETASSGETVSTEETTPSEEVVSTEITAPSEEVVSTETTAPSEEAVSTETTAPSEEAVSTETTAPSEEAVSTETTVPSEEAVSTETTAPSEEAVSTETTAPSEEAVSTETTAPSEEAVSTETTAPSEETVSTETTETKEKEYTICLIHVLYTEGGYYAQQEEITVLESQLTNGTYDVSGYAVTMEGMQLDSVELEAFEDGVAMAYLTYSLSDGYKAVSNVQAAGMSTFAGNGASQDFLGTFDDITIVEAGKVMVTYSFFYENGVIARAAEVVEQTEKESYSYEIENIPDGYTVRVEADDLFEFVESTNTITSTLPEGADEQNVSVIFVAKEVDYKVIHSFEQADGTYKVSEEKTEVKQGKVGSTTAAEALTTGADLANYSAQPVKQQTIQASGTEVTITYKLKTYKLTYDTQGGSYIKAKTGRYGAEVEVYSTTEETKRVEDGKKQTCKTGEHMHNIFAGCYEYDWWSGEYKITCKRTEHTHNDACYEITYKTETVYTYNPTPVKQGYTFAGWYLDEACTQEASKQITLSGNVTVYAKWVANKVNYTVAYYYGVWNNTEGKEGEEFVYSHSKTVEGTVGTPVSGSNDLSMNYYEFDADKTDKNVVVKADGSTVVNVYYRLKRYTFTFKLNDSKAYITFDGGKTKYYDKNAYTIKDVVLGKDISAEWPTKDNVKGTSSTFRAWEHEKCNTRHVTKCIEVTEHMLSSTTYTALWESGNNKEVEYWLQTVDGQKYKKSDSHSQSFVQGIGSEFDAKDIYGFTKVDGTPDGYEPTSGNTYRFYYKRDQYKIVYYYKDKEIENPDADSVYYGADINSDKYNFKPGKPSDLGEGYTFEGWYDNADLAGEPYKFTTMPGGNLVLYAKWEAPKVKVTVKVTKETADSAATIYEVEKGKTLSELPTPTRDGYTFEGWYVSEDDGEVEFDILEPIMKDTTVYAKWEENKVASYTVKYVAMINGAEVEVAASKTVEDVAVGTSITEYAKVLTDEKYADYAVDEAFKTITIAKEEAKNEIKFVYAATGDITYTVQYKYGDTVVLEQKDLKAKAKAFTISTSQAQVEYLLKKGYSLPLTSKFVTLSSDSSKNIIVFELTLANFKISYTGVEGAVWNGNEANPNPAAYTIEGLPITLTNPSKDGYVFAGWELGEGTKIVEAGEVQPSATLRDPMDVTIGENTTGNLTFVATWKKAIRLEAGSKSWQYDENEHTYGEFKVNDVESVNGKAVLDGDVFAVKMTKDSKIQYVGSVPNKIDLATLTINGKSIEETEYAVVEEPLDGTLKIVVDEYPVATKADTQKDDYSYALNSTVYYTITVTNVYPTAQTITVKEQNGVKFSANQSSNITVKDGTATAENVAPGAKVIFWAEYTVTEDDIFKAEFSNTVDVEFSNGETFTETEKVKIDGKAPKLTLVMEYEPSKKAGTAELFDVGDEINYTFTVQNTGNITLDHVTIVSEKLQFVISADNGTKTLQTGSIDVGTLKPGDESGTVEAVYTVTEADVNSKKIINEALANGTDREGNTVYSNPQHKTHVPASPNPSISVKKETVPEGKNEYSYGDSIEYKITVSNSGNVALKNVIVDDTLKNDSNFALKPQEGITKNEKDGTWKIESLAKGESKEIYAVYKVTGDDVVATKVVNTVTAAGDTASGEHVESLPSTVTVDVLQKNPVQKTTALQKEQYALGDTVTFKITVENMFDTNKDITVTEKENVTIELDKTQNIVAGEVPGTVVAKAVAPGKKVVFTAVYTITEEDIKAGKYENTAVVSFEGVEPSFTDSVTVKTEPVNPKVTVEKQTTNAPTDTDSKAYGYGEAIEYRVTVTNAGNVTLENVNLIEELDVTVAEVTASEGVTAEISKGSKLNKSVPAKVGTLAPGESVTFQVSYKVTDEDILTNKADHSLKNAVTVTGEYEGKTEYNSQEIKAYDSVTDKIAEVAPKLLVEKSVAGESVADKIYQIGDTITYNISVTNKGNVPISNVTVVDKLPGVTVSGKGSLGNLEPNDTKTIQATYTVKQEDVLKGNTLVNTATATGTLPYTEGPALKVNEDSATVKLATAKAGLAVTKSVDREDKTYGLGEDVFYTITVTNTCQDGTGNATLYDIVVTDKLAGVEIAEDSPHKSWEIASLASGEQKKIKAKYTVTGMDTLEETVTNTVSAAGYLDNVENHDESKKVESDPAQVVITILSHNPVVKSHGDENAVYRLGDMITFTIEVTNIFDTPQTITVTEQNGVTIQGAVNGKGVAENVAPGGTVTFTATHVVTEEDILNGGGFYTNTVSAEFDGITGEKFESTDQAKIDSPKSDMAVTKVVTNTPEKNGKYALNESITYKITIENKGNVTLKDVKLTEALEVVVDKISVPEGVTPSITKGSTLGENTAYALGTLAPNAKIEIEVSYTVNEQDIKNQNVKNVVTADATSEQGEKLQKKADALKAVEEPSKLLAIEKISEDDKKLYQIGDTIVYWITVENKGNVTVDNVVVSDKLAGVTIAEDSPNTSWNLGSLAPGQVEQIKAEYTVTEADVVNNNGQLTNAVTVVGTGTDEVPDSVVNTIPTKNPALVVTKTAKAKEDGSEFGYGDTITYEITVTNPQQPENLADDEVSVTLYDITVTDELAGVTIAEDSPHKSWDIDSLAPGEAKTIKAEYTVTGKDTLAREVRNTAYAVGYMDNVDKHEQDMQVESNKATASVDVVSYNPVTKTHTSGTYKLNDVVTFTIEVLNIFDEPKTITAEEQPGVEIVSAVGGTNVILETDKAVVENVEAGEKAVFTAQYKITKTDILNQTFKNTVKASFSGSENAKFEREDTVTVEKKNPEIQVTKQVVATGVPANGKAYVLGETIGYEIAVENTGNVDLKDVEVRDSLPVRVADDTPLKVGDLKQGEIKYIIADYTVKEADILRGYVTNNAKAKASFEGTSFESRIASVTSNTDTAKSNLVVEKSIIDEKSLYEVGDVIRYKITVTNKGNVTVSDVEVNDSLEVQFVDDKKIGTLEPGASKEVEVRYEVTQKDVLEGNKLLNTATATGKVPPKAPKLDVVPGEKTAFLASPEAELAVIKTADAEEYAWGNTITYTITVKNTKQVDGEEVANVTIHGVVVTDELVNADTNEKLTGVTLQKGDWQIGDLGPGEEETIIATYKVTGRDALEGAELTNTATAVGHLDDEKKTEKRADDSVTVQVAAYEDLVVKTHTADRAYALDEKVTFEIKVVNIFDTEQTITVTELEGVKIVGVTGSEDYSIENNVAVIRKVAAGKEVYVTAEYTITEEDILKGSFENTASVSFSGIKDKEFTDEDKVSVEEAKPAMVVTKTTTSTPENGEAYVLGEQILYDITVKNTGNVTLTEVEVTEALPVEVTEGSMKITELAPGDEETVKVAYTVTEEDILEGVVVNEATASGKTPDEVEKEPVVEPGNSENDVDEPNRHLTVTKSATDDVNADGSAKLYQAGDTIHYVINVKNDGNLTIEDIIVEDTLWIGDGREVSVTLEEGESWQIEALAPGASAEVKVFYTVTEEDVLSNAGMIVNTAAARTEGTEPDGTTEPEVTPGTEEAPIPKAEPGIAVRKEAEEKEGGYGVGETITYTITVINTGNVNVENIKVTDPLTGMDELIESLAPQAYKVFTTEYTVTEADLIKGAVYNTATVQGTLADGTPIEETAEEETATESKAGKLSLHKEATSTPANGTYYVIGETVVYSITAENTGNLTLTGVTVSDELTGDTWLLKELAPGASETFTASYTVTREDVEKGNEIINVATGTAGTNDPATPVIPVVPDEEIVSIEELYTLTIHYVNAAGAAVAADYTGEYVQGEQFSITSPTVAGYTPNYSLVKSDENGMPARDLEFTVVYVLTAPTPGTTPAPTPGTTPGTTPDTTPEAAVPTPAVPAPAVPTPAAPTPTPEVPTEPEIEPTPGVVTPTEDGDYVLTPIEDEETPLANVDLDNHKCCILHFLLMLAALIVLISYTRSKKEHQEKIFALREELELERQKRGLPPLTVELSEKKDAERIE